MAELFQTTKQNVSLHIQKAEETSNRLPRQTHVFVPAGRVTPHSRGLSHLVACHPDKIKSHEIQDQYEIDASRHRNRVR
jgi:hypothetical protein